MTLTRRQWIASAIVAVFFAASAGFFVGVELSLTDDPSAASIDARFLVDMSDHHEQAIQMSILALRHGEEDDIHTFAREILYQQAYEIGAMERQLEAWGISRQNQPAHTMPGMATTDEIDALGDARGRAADALFVRLMQDHHRGGVAMAETATASAKTAFVRALAARMARTQRLEIREMERALQRAGLEPRPAGWTPDAFDVDDAADHSGH